MRLPRSTPRGRAGTPTTGPRADADLPPPLARALSVLAPVERRVLWMRIGRAMSSAEVADALSMTTASVRVVQHRALTALRAHLARTGENPPSLGG